VWTIDPAGKENRSVYPCFERQALIDLVGKGYFPNGSRILYAHLGGAPALNGYAYTFRNG
jgi:1-aminocyclopropane-1-carboxylate deaminase